MCLQGWVRFWYSDPIYLEGFFARIVKNLAWEISWLVRFPLMKKHLSTLLICISIYLLKMSCHWLPKHFLASSASFPPHYVHHVYIKCCYFLAVSCVYFSPILKKWQLCCTHRVSQLCKPTWLHFSACTCWDIFVPYWSNLQKSSPNRRWFLECNSCLVWWGVNQNQTTRV